MTSPAIAIRPLALPFDATLTLPGSKSHANRAIVAACLAEGTTILRSATPCDDVALLVENVRAMGFEAAWRDRENGILAIRGGVPAAPRTATLSCGNAGTTLRFLASLACLVPGTWTVTGNERMRLRPVGDLTAALRALGADIRDTNGCPPLTIKGGTIRGGTVTLDASKSSQFLSSLLLVGAALPDGLTVRVSSSLASPSYADLTRRVLRDFGGETTKEGNVFSVARGPLRSPETYDIEGDWSAAGAFLVLAELAHSRVRFSNLHEDSAQGDRALPGVIASLRGNGDRTVDCADIPDQLMNLAILAARRDGVTVFTGAGNVRLKETDRLAVLREELTKAGIVVEERRDGILVRGKAKPRPSVLDPHDDHRMAMCFAVLGSLRDGIRIEHPDCVSKSYPRFFDDLAALHRSPRCIAIVGMRGCGKTILGKRLASKLKLKRADIDALFEKEHGPVRAFVAERGWPAFRAEEEALIQRALQPGSVVSLGGGAVESERTRAALKRESLPVWLQAGKRLIEERLRSGKRPPLTDLPLREEVDLLFRKRTPLYREVAAVTIPERVPVSQKIHRLIALLRRQCSW